jgi:DNA-binding GntR family transcriptional regulator
VYDALRQRVVSGAFHPGESLGEESLAQQLGVSRTPIREAFRRLSEQGFLEYKPHCGARVAQPTPEWVTEIFTLREALEGIAARSAALQSDPVELHTMRRRFESLRPAVARGDYSDVGDAIHPLLITAARNRTLERTLDVLRGQVSWVQQITQSMPSRLENAFHEHDAVLRALEARDPEWAESAIRAHVRNTARELIAHLGQRAA